MPRIRRGLVDGFVYHVLNRGNGRQRVFHRSRDYRTFVELMMDAKARYSVKVFAFCLMPDHFHMILMPTKAEDLSKWMQWLMTSHVRRYHRDNGTSGHVWQGRYKSFVVQSGEHLLTGLKYVEANPVRAGLVKSAKEWLWSSHRSVIGDGMRMLLDRAPVALPPDWDRYVDEPLTEDVLERIRMSVRRQSPYGDARWQMEIVRKLGLESTLRPRGRPSTRVR
ncbi:MAG: transposase [Nitrospirae bacterium]|nr:transposase [Nitrospirota bacterium]